MGIIASSGIEKTIRLWSEFTQSTFKGSKLEKSSKFSASSPIDREQALNRYQEVIYDDSNSTLPQYQEDEEMILFFDAMRDESEINENIPDVDEDSIVGTSMMLNFHDSDFSTSDSDSDDSENGFLEPISLSDSERVNLEERFQETRTAHAIKRQLQSINTGISVPTVLVSSSSSESESEEERKAEMRKRNAKRKRK